MGSIFALIELILKLLKLWDGLMDYSDSKRAAEREAARQAREKAIEDSKKAETDDDIWKSQDGIVNNQPKP